MTALEKILPIETEGQKIAKILAAIVFFAAMRPQTKNLLQREGRIQSVPKGHIIFMNEDDAARFYLIQRGWVKIFRETLGGEEAILDVLTAGSVFGETSIFENKAYAYGAEVIEDAVILSFPSHILENETAENIDFALSFLQHISRKNLAKDKEIELRSVQNAAQRIGCFLLRLCKTEQRSATLHLAWEKSLIAARLGMTPETFSRSLAKLQKEAGIHIKGPTITISDIGMLVRYTCTACSNVFPCDN